jgi:fibrillarin-like pre-rRNA processing protein
VDPTAWKGVFRSGRDLYTKNRVPGRRVYGETLKSENGVEYRLWDPWRSKLAAFLLKAQPKLGWDGVRRTLYLGAAHGTTVSHLSDALADAELFAVEKSPLAFAPLLALARERDNVYPLLADAQLPERYRADVGAVDLLYQDVAQRAQARIFVENVAACLVPGGQGLLMLKVRSVTQRRPSGAILDATRRELGAAGLRVRATCDLAPFAREHVALAIDA